jgi:spore germination protein
VTPRRVRNISLIVMVLLLIISTTVLAAPYGSRALYKGSFGGDVVELQRRLASLGYAPGSSDGIFGGETREAVIHFQTDYGLVPDGLADKWTFRAVDRAFTWQKGSFYAVVAGDSLWAIAQKNGTEVELISWLNQLQDSMLYPGQVLRLPVAVADSGGITGSTLPDIAAKPPVIVSRQSQPPTSSAPDPAEQTPPTPTEQTPPTPVPTEQTPPAPATTDPVVSSHGTMVLGYYAEDWIGDSGSLTSLKNALHQVDLVVNFQLSIDAQGAIATRDYPELAAEAKAQGIKVQGLVHNLTADGFDTNVARTVLSDPAVRSKAVQNLLAVAKEQGLSGINVDIENVPPDQRPNYTAFVKELSEALHARGLDLTLSIPAKTWDDTKSAWSGAFDYKALGALADRVVPMAYDEHTIGYSAGPVASFGWVDKVAAFASSQIPQEKVLLGIPAYGYDWKKGTTEGRGISVPGAMNLALKYGAQIQWDTDARVPYFSYVNNGQERVVYFENARSTGEKLELVQKYGLGGIAIWRMGLEDPAIWSVIADKLR